MKKTVIVEFPDGFEFPEKLDSDSCTYSKCITCPFCYSDGWNGYCNLNDDWDATEKNERKPCPFYGGNDSFVLKAEE